MTTITTVTGTTVRIRPAGGDDAADLYAGFSRVVDAGEGYPQAPGITEEEFQDYWLEHKSSVMVARCGQELAGSYYLKPNFPGRGAHIANAGYFVVEEWRGRGIGRALVEHSFEQARGHGFDAMMFNLVFESNPARALYEELGFREVGRVPEAIEGETAIVYWRRL